MQELSRDALEAIVGSIPAGVVVIEKEKGRTIYANERAIQLFGVDPLGLELPEHSTKLIKLLTLNGDVYPPEQLPASVALLTGKEAQAEVVIERQDGSRVITVGSSKPIRDEKGEVIAAVAIFEDITERKQAEEVLRVSEEKFSKAFEGSLFAVTLTRLSDGTIVEVNDAGQKLFGFDRSEIIGKTTLELQTWANINDRNVLATKLSQKGSFNNQEVTLLKKDGTCFDVVMSGAIVTINAEKYWIASFIDITDRKKAEEALRQSEEKYRQIVTTAQEGILILDQQGKITYLNQVLADWIGYRIEEVIGEFVFKFIAKEDLEKTYERWEKRRIDVVESYDLRLRRKDGVDIWLIVNGTSLKDKEGNFVGLLAMISNITERKRVELACKESEERFRDLVESTSDWIWQVDQNAVYTYVSPKVKDILGYEPQEVLGKTPFDLMPKDQVEEMTKIFTETAKNKSRLHNLENLAVHKNGKIVVLETSGVPIEDEKGNLVGYRGIDRDITQRKKVEQSLRESEALYHTLFDNSQDGFMLLEPLFDETGKAVDFRFLKINSAYERQTGAKADDVLGKKASEVTPELESEITLISGDVSITGKPVHNEAYNKYSDKWYDSYYFLYLKGQVGILFRDITERKKTEQMLKESQKKYQDLTETTNDLVWEMDAKGRYTYVSPQVEKLWGTKPADMMGKTFFDAMPPIEKESALEVFLKMGSSQEPFSGFQTTAYDSRGHLIYVETNGVPFFDSRGRLLGFRGISRDITERKKAEETMRAEKERFESLANSLPEIVFETDISGKVVFANERGFEITGYVREDLAKGLDVFTLIAPQDKEKAVEHFNRTLNNQPSIDNEYKVLRRDGSIFPAIIIANTIVKEGQPTGLRGLVIDITERKKAEETLRLSEERFDQMIEQSPIVFEVYDMQGFQIKVNAAYEKFWNISKELTLGKYNILKSEQVIKDNLLQYVERAYAGEIVNLPVYQYDASLEPSTGGLGRKRWLNATLYPLRDEHGQVAGIVVLHEDVTERKNAEEALRGSEEKFQSMIEQSPVVFGLYDKKGFLVQVNKFWDDLWQVPREYVVGKWNILKSKQVKEIGWLSLLERAYVGEIVHAPAKEFDASLEPEASGKGRKRWLESVFYPIRNVYGEVVNVVLMSEDVTERKNLEKQLLDNERMVAIGQTAGMVGHDIRNPLQAVLSEAYLLKDELASMPEGINKEGVAESIDSIERNVAYINKIVQDLQDYSRQVVPEYSVVDLSDVFVHVFETISIPESINFSINVKDAEKIRIDPALLQRAIVNLVNNAIQAMPDGGKLDICGEKIGTRIVVTVSDSGVGIPDEVKPKLFTPMMTTKAKGQGFGLAASKRMIEAMKGTIMFESEKGKGTKFIIELPHQSSF